MPRSGLRPTMPAGTNGRRLQDFVQSLLLEARPPPIFFAVPGRREYDCLGLVRLLECELCVVTPDASACAHTVWTIRGVGQPPIRLECGGTGGAMNASGAEPQSEAEVHHQLAASADPTADVGAGAPACRPRWHDPQACARMLQRTGPVPTSANSSSALYRPQDFRERQPQPMQPSRELRSRSRYAMRSSSA